MPLSDVIAELRHRMLDNALDAFIAIDGYSNILVWSCKAEKLFGWSTEDAAGQSLTTLLLPERYRAAHEEALRRHRDHVAPDVVSRRMEVCALHRDGHEIPVELSLSAIEVNGIQYYSAALRDVSEWRKMEEALAQRTRELEQSRAALQRQSDILRAVLDSIAEGVTVADLNKRLILRNRAAEEMLGVEPDAPAGGNMYTLYHPETQAPLPAEQRPMNRAIQGQATDNALLMARPPGRQGILVCANARPLKNSRGELIGGVVVFRDVTAQKQHEQALQESEAHYRSLMESAQGYFIYRAALDASEPTGVRIVMVSPSVKDILGIDDPSRAEQWFAHVHPEDLPRLRDANARCVACGTVFNEQFRWFHPVLREWRWLQTISSPVEAAPGPWTLFNGITIDITGQKRSEATVRQLAGILEQTTDMVSFATVGGKILYMNPAGLKLLGRDSADEVVGTDARACFPARMGPMYLNEALPAVLREGSWSGEAALVNRQGEEVPVSQVILGHRNEAGEVEYLSTIIRDIRPLKQIEASLRELAAHQQAAREEERKRIAREIHDDLGSSLTAIKLQIALCSQAMQHVTGFPAAKVEDVLRIIDQATVSLRRIIDDLRPSVLDTLGLWAAIDWQAVAFQERTGIACAVTIDGGEREVDADRATAVFRIFQEALSNVYRHAGASRVAVAVAIQPEAASMTIQDNGRGIRDEDLGKSNSYGLLGMRERARQFGIRLEVQRNDKGTRITLRFPLMQA